MRRRSVTARTSPGWRWASRLPPRRPRSPTRPRASRAPACASSGMPSRHRSGEGVLIGLIDVGGFDFAHPDFLDADGEDPLRAHLGPGRRARPPAERGPTRSSYGAELAQERAEPCDRRRTERLRPPTGSSPSRSGARARTARTSPASPPATAASAARRCIAGVLIASREDDDRRTRSTTRPGSPTPSTTCSLPSSSSELGAAGVDQHQPRHQRPRARRSSAVSRWIDSALSVPGRSVCVAAGNAGQERAETTGDIGYIMGRIHTSGQVAARGLVSDIEWNVVGNGIADVSENELEIWYGAQDRFAVSGQAARRAVDRRRSSRASSSRTAQLADGTFLSVYNELYHPANGANYIAIYLEPVLLAEPPIVGVPAGKWLVRLIGARGSRRPLPRLDRARRPAPPRPDRRSGGLACSRRSSPSAPTSTTRRSVRWPAGSGSSRSPTSTRPRQRITITSSQGPTRDGRHKPDVAAPGTDDRRRQGLLAGRRRAGSR